MPQNKPRAITHRTTRSAHTHTYKVAMFMLAGALLQQYCTDHTSLTYAAE